MHAAVAVMHHLKHHMKLIGIGPANGSRFDRLNDTLLSPPFRSRVGQVTVCSMLTPMTESLQITHSLPTLSGISS